MLNKLGKYEILEEVGRGAMGQVYKARDPLIGRLVALKTITSGMVGRPDLLERFYQEARSAGALQHPNIVTVYELGKEGETPFIAMEFLEGESLEGVIARHPVLTLTQKIGYMVPVCRALDYAHRRGVVHRDIKPGNVMITADGGVKVVDFGIARLMDSSQTQTNTLIGTLGYMSPQQIRGDRADARSDIWATGVVLYELLTFRRPFEGDNQAALMLNIASDDVQPPPLKDAVPDLPPALEALIGKMLQKDHTQRYQTMEEVLLDFEPIWRRLQESSVAAMIEGCEDLIHGGQFARARDVLRRALQIDSRNSRAKTLLEQVNAELRETILRSQVDTMIEKARAALNEGRHAEAKNEAEAVLRLEPENETARELILECGRAAERDRKIEDGLRAARQKLAEGGLEDAAAQVRQILRFDSDNALARALEKQIDEMIAQREARKRLAEILQRARKLWGEQKHESCLALLGDADREFPGDPEIQRLMEMARQELADQRRRQLLTDAKALLAEQQFEEALAAVDAAAKEFPDDPSTKRLREMIQQEQEASARQKELQKEIAELQALVNAEKYAEAVFRGEKLLREYPKHAELFDLMNYARAEAAKLEQKRQVAEALAEVQARIEHELFPEAVLLAQRSLERFPKDEPLRAALEQARAGLKGQERQQLLEQRIAEMELKFNSGQQAAAMEFARKTLEAFGPNEQVSQFLRSARERMQANQTETVVSPQTSSGEDSVAASKDPANAEPLAAEAGADSGSATVATPTDSAGEDSAPFPAHVLSLRTLATEEPAAPKRSFFVPIVVGIAVLVAVGFVAVRFRSNGPTARENELHEQAQYLEQVRDWPGALASYKSLAVLGGKLSPDASAQATRLQSLIDKENNLFEDAQNLATAGNFAAAKASYQQAADLHGDREQEATMSTAKLDAEIASALPPAEKPAPPAPILHAKPTAPKAPKSTPAPKAVAAAATTPAQAKPTADCQLIPSDISRYLDMADNNRGRGKYSDAERQYNAVLQCEPDNDRAHTGLTRTKQAEAISSSPSP